MSKNKQKELKRLYSQIKKTIKPLDKLEIDVYAAHFYSFLEVHQKYIKTNTYRKYWQIFRAMKEGRVKDAIENQEALGQYGLSLISLILYSGDSELDLIERLIALNSLLNFISGKDGE